MSRFLQEWRGNYENGNDRDQQKLTGKYGSVLKAWVIQERGSFEKLLRKEALAFGSVLLPSVVGGIIFGIVHKVLVLWIPAACMLFLFAVVGSVFYQKRSKKYLAFYQKRTGYTIEEIREADREALGPGAVRIVGMSARDKEEVLCIVTKHYFLSVWAMKGCYLIKLEDIAAVFYSCRIPEMLECVEGLYIVSKQETERGGTASAIPGKEIAGFANTMIRDQGSARK